MVGLQECLELEEVREIIWEYLGGGQEYRIFKKVGWWVRSC